MIRALPVLVICLAFAGCARFPDVEARQAQFASRAEPQLVPVENLLVLAGPGRTGEAASAALDGRAAGLRARAKAMRGPVHSPATRARLAAAVAAHPALIN